MKDLIDDCISDLGQKRDYKAFQAAFCDHCRNPNCIHAKWSKDKFADRVTKQPDRFFNLPQTDFRNPKYAVLVDFTNMIREALRLEISDRKKDWSIPEIPILDGQDQSSDKSVTSAVDDAIKRLAETKGKNINLPDPIEAETEEFIQETEQIMEQETPEPEISEPATCRQDADRETPEPEIRPPKPDTSPAAPILGNTAVPPGGVVVGDGPPPNTPPPKDDWAVPDKSDIPLVAPGTKITLTNDGDD